MGEAAKKIESSEPSSGLQESWNRRVLVVEDERELASCYKDILCSQNKVVPIVRSSRSKTSVQAEATDNYDFELVMVHSAQDALTEVRKAIHQGRPFAMGFFDVRLGGTMDGYELVKEIQKISPEMYAVFVTAYNDRSIDSIHNYLGKDRVDHWDYLNKPFSTGEILQKARNFITLWNFRREREQREKQLADANMRLLDSERMAAVNTVARGMGHELGNILMQIMGKADISLDKGHTEMKEALEAILDVTQKASDILDNFKDLASGHRHEVEKDNLSPSDILQGVLDLMEHQLKVHDIKVCKIKNDPVLIPVDPTALLQVFINIITNSIQAMGKSGQLDISVNDLGKSVEVKLRDYGPGISSAIMSKVTDPFFTTKGSQGTGLGLAICKEIVEIEHGGEFSIQNPPGKGVEVVMRFPKEQKGR